ncbi:MAG: lipase family protein [Wenzhouxiangellaceae bacterium]
MEILGLLESTIGLVLIYLVLSLIGSAWVEAIVNWTGLRGENLRKLIEIQCGGDEQIANLLLAQPQLRALYASSQSISWFGRLVRRMLALCFDRGQSQQKSGFRPPSYIPPLRFARALSDMALGDDVERLRSAPELIEHRLSEPGVLVQLRRCCDQTQENAKRGEVPIRADQCRPDDDSLKKAASHISKVLTKLWHQAGGDPDAFMQQIAKWFEDGNDRASGWFKRKLAPMLFAVGLVLAFALNVDSIQILSRLSGDAEMRRSLVIMAVDKVENMPADVEESAGELKAEFDRAKQSLLEMEPLVGWRASSLPTEASYGDWVRWSLSKLIGLLVTAIALSLGAPFWFEILRKLVRARTSISQLDAEETVARQPAPPAGVAAPKTDGHDSSAHPSGAGRPTEAEPRLQSGMLGLALDAQAPDRLNARWMARLSDLAYSGRAQAELALKDMELRLDHWMDSGADRPDASIGDVDTQGFLASNRDLAVVAFRGTEVNLANPADVLTDIKARMAEIDWFPDGPKPRAHRGFLLALDAVWSELQQQLKSLSAINPARPIWFTGHSLGGALAVLAASRYSIWRADENLKRETRADQLLNQLGENAGGLLNNDARMAAMDRIRREASPLPPCRWIYTIGQPAVGDQRLADWLEAHFGQRLVRTINNRDIVPRLPTPILGYVQAGAELYFDSFGRMKINPGAWYRNLDTLLIDPERARAGALEAVGDHKAETYIALLNGPKAKTA